MCEIGNNFKLCSCVVNEKIDTIIDTKKSKRQKKHRPKKDLRFNSDSIYKWTLYKYVGLQEQPKDGILFPPADELGENLTNEIVISKLNNETCFDFEYKPNDGDNLVIYTDDKFGYNFLSFIYRDKKWNVDTYNSFIDNKERINHGKIVKE